MPDRGDRGQPSAALRSRLPVPAPRSRMHPEKPVVLVVDDDSDCRTIYAMHLRSAGCEVFTANDGRSAVDKTNDLRPDIIVMDLATPRVDGWEGIGRLHDSSWTPQTPII